MDYVYIVKATFQNYDEILAPEVDIISAWANQVEAISAAEHEMRRQVGEDGTYTSHEGDDCEFEFEAKLEGGYLTIEVEAWPVRGERF